MKTYKNVELPKGNSNKLKDFLKSNKIKFETSGADNLIHFEILVSRLDEEKINKFLSELD